jgi:hypothetical protein
MNYWQKFCASPIDPNKLAGCQPHGKSHGRDGESFERRCSRYFDRQSSDLFVWLFLTAAPVRSCI